MSLVNMPPAISTVTIHLVNYIGVSYPEKNGFKFNKTNNSTMGFKPCLEGGKSFMKPMGMCLWFRMSFSLDGHTLFVAIMTMSALMGENGFQSPWSLAPNFLFFTVQYGN